MDGLASALLYNRQFLEAEDTILCLFGAQAGFTIEGIAHKHFMGRCEGSLTLAPTGIEFAADDGDHGFAAEPSRILSTSLEDETATPSFRVEISTGPDDDKHFDFVVPIFLEEKGGLSVGGLAVGRRLSGEDGALEDTTRLHRVLVRVVEDHVMAR